MRGAKGKLICVWSPVLHGEGCSTVACGIGFGMQHYSGRSVLIVNLSNSTSHMERYVENDIKIKYSMDNLKIFNTGIRTEHILTYATQVNTGLYMIAGSRFNREITRENTDFDRLFIERCMDGFDLIIADLDTGVREDGKLYLDYADSILAVFTPNEIIIDELYRHPGMKEALGYFTDEKTVCIINKLYDGWEAGGVTGRYKSRYSLPRIFGLDYDGDVLNACCTERDFYSFLMKEVKRGKNGFVRQLIDICEYLADGLYIENNSADSIKYGSIFKKLLRSSIY
jgi:hypothetical protein